MVSADAYDETRVAGVDDVAGIIQLIKPLEESGVLLRRSRDKLENEINQFTVMERDGTIIACAAMYEFPGSDAVELGCLAVHPSYRNGERGDALLAEGGITCSLGRRVRNSCSCLQPEPNSGSPNVGFRWWVPTPCPSKDRHFTTISEVLRCLLNPCSCDSAVSFAVSAFTRPPHPE